MVCARVSNPKTIWVSGWRPIRPISPVLEAPSHCGSGGGETEVAPYFLHVPTRAEVERVRKRSHKSDAAAPALAEDD